MLCLIPLIFTVEITGLTSKGFGGAKIESFTVFVEGALPGEKEDIKIVRLQKTYGYDKLLREPSH